MPAGYVTVFPSQRDASLACQFPTPTSLAGSCTYLGQNYHPGERWEFTFHLKGGERQHETQCRVGDDRDPETMGPGYAGVAEEEAHFQARTEVCFPL